MKNAELIMRMAKENNGVITSAKVTESGLSRGTLKYLTDIGKLERSARGVYILPEVWADEIYNLQVQFKRGIFSGETALFLNDLSDRTPNSYQMTFPIGYNVTSLKNENVKAVRAAKKLYELGIITVLTPGGNPVRAYNKEKTLCDILRGRSNTDIQIVSDAFKQYVRSENINIPLLLNMQKYSESKEASFLSGGPDMKNAMQLKSTIKKISKEKGISAQLIMQNYMLERLLERISISKYQPNFILKGGFLIASIVGLDTRATMDMDATIKGLPVTEEHLLAMFTDICNIEIDDNVTFTFKSISSIRAKDEYSGYRISLTANYPPMSVPLKLDITTGDKITPREITYDFKLLLEDRIIQILSYNLETVMSEKIETVIARGDQNTRPRDFYDIYILHKLQGRNIDYSNLSKALQETAKKRHSEEIIKDHKEIISVIQNSDIMNKRWKDYQKDLSYAQNIEFQSTLLTLIEIMNII